jgi:hypothetical protein
MCLYWKKNLLQNQLANFNQTWYKLSLGKGNPKLFKLSTLKGKIITKMGWSHLKIFSRTTELEKLIYTWKLSDIRHIQFYTNHGPQGSRGATIGKTIFILKKIFSRTSRPISMKLSTNHPRLKRIKNCSQEGPGSFPRGDNHRNTKIG